MRTLVAMAALSLIALASCSAEAPAPFPTATPLPGEPLPEESLEFLPPLIRFANPRLIVHENGNKEVWWDRDAALNMKVRGEIPFCLPKDYDPAEYPEIANRNPCITMPDHIAIGPPG